MLHYYTRLARNNTLSTVSRKLFELKLYKKLTKWKAIALYFLVWTPFQTKIFMSKVLSSIYTQISISYGTLCSLKNELFAKQVNSWTTSSPRPLLLSPLLAVRLRDYEMSTDPDPKNTF